MYQVHLTEAYFPAQADSPVLPTTVGGLLRERARLSPDAPALEECDVAGRLGRRWTYGALLADAERLARALLTRFSPGERICVWAPNVPEWVILEYAAGLAGLTLVTANPAYRPRELKYVLEQSKSVGLFFVESHRGNPMLQIAGEASAGNERLRETTLLTDHAALFAGEDETPALPDVKPEDPVQIQYTSGTTGFPKGVVLSHLGITNNARLFYERMSPDIRTAINMMPMFHTSGCGMGTLGAVQFGVRMILAALFEPARMLEMIELEKVDVLLGVPTMLVAMCEVQQASPRDVGSIKCAASGGSMVPPELVRRVQQLFGATIQTVYGQTESSPLLTMIQADDAFEDVCFTIGQPIPQTEMSIRRADNSVAAVDETGEICARGYCVMLGYNDNPQATAAAIDADGWLHTGDLGTMDARGYLKITGRVKEMIIRGGENLFPAEIENVLIEHPDVAEVAVVGAPDPKWGEIVVAFLRLREGARLDRAALAAHCREHISPQKTPAHWIEIDAWPLTGSGKIQKFVLSQWFAEGRFETA
jgi:fatty-acyl-CoA synthase